MMSKLNDISDADRELFRNSVGAVEKIKHARMPVRKPRPAPVPVQRDADAQAVIREMASAPMVNDHCLTGDELFFKRPGMQDKVLSKLRKGRFAIERELDLHGMNSKDAQAALGRFLLHCRHHNIRCVRIIHGKGRGSRDRQPVIKNKLNQWLQNIPQVLAFCSARASDGGTGAVYVLLKNTG
jgi:DNA-nicking Smr family endonuclease